MKCTGKRNGFFEDTFGNRIIIPVADKGNSHMIERPPVCTVMAERTALTGPFGKLRCSETYNCATYGQDQYCENGFSKHIHTNLFLVSILYASQLCKQLKLR